MTSIEIADVSIKMFQEYFQNELDYIPSKFAVVNIRNPLPPVKSTLQKPGIDRVKH